MGSKTILQAAFWDRESFIYHEGVTFTASEQTPARKDVTIEPSEELPVFDDFEIKEGYLLLFSS